MRRDPVPSGDTVHAELPLKYAISVPSGDHAGKLSHQPPAVSATRPEPSAPMTAM